MKSSVQKIREALEKVISKWEMFREGLEYDLDGHYPNGYRGRCEDMEEVIQSVHTALNLPLRNCDVGTADEQFRRFDVYCTQQRTCKDANRVTCVVCFGKWGQMPYTEGAENEQG